MSLRVKLIAGVTCAVLAGCTLPQAGGTGGGGSATILTSAANRDTVPVAAPRVWNGGAYGFQEDMYWVADQYAIMLERLNPAPWVVERCMHLRWAGELPDRDHRRMCVALDYMVHRDQRFHVRARELARDPYFGEDAFAGRVSRYIPWAGFRDAADLFEFDRIAWSYVEPLTINRLHKEFLPYLDGRNG